MRAILSALFLFVISSGCKESFQNSVKLPLRVMGTSLDEPVLAQNDTKILLDRADLAFGPLYLCAGVNAGDLCDVARLEWLDSAVINTLDDQVQQVGDLRGVTGQVLSWMYDLGISSQLTRDDPFILAAAEELGDQSMVLEGRAVVDEFEIPFTASLSLKQSDDTELGVTIIRKSLSDRFNKDVTLDDQNLTIQFNPADWVKNLDFNTYLERKECSIDNPDLVCNGNQELTCAEGQIVSERSCDDLNQICISKQGCVEQLVIEAGSEPYRAIRNAVFSGVRPTFTWNQK